VEVWEEELCDESWKEVWKSIGRGGRKPHLMESSKNSGKSDK
jgi:hypothetical protein